MYVRSKQACVRTSLSTPSSSSTIATAAFRYGMPTVSVLTGPSKIHRSLSAFRTSCDGLALVTRTSDSNERRTHLQTRPAPLGATADVRAPTSRGFVQNLDPNRTHLLTEKASDLSKSLRPLSGSTTAIRHTSARCKTSVRSVSPLSMSRTDERVSPNSVPA